MSGRYTLEDVRRATTIASDVSGQSEKQKNISTDKQQTIMKRIKITAIAKNGKCLNIGFKNEQMAEEYATAMMQRGYVCVKQYR
jgi:hypothetical protein